MRLARAGPLESHFSPFPARNGANQVTSRRRRVQASRIEHDFGYSIHSKRGFWGRRKWPRAFRIRRPRKACGAGRKEVQLEKVLTKKVLGGRGLGLLLGPNTHRRGCDSLQPARSNSLLGSPGSATGSCGPQRTPEALSGVLAERVSCPRCYPFLGARTLPNQGFRQKENGIRTPINIFPGSILRFPQLTFSTDVDMLWSASRFRFRGRRTWPQAGQSADPGRREGQGRCN